LARRATASRRSGGLIPRSRVESSGISSCFGVGGFVLGSCIGLLLSGDNVARAASTLSASLQKVVEVTQSRHGHARRADLHADAGRRVEHPRGYHCYDAGQNLNVDEPARRPIVAPLNPDATAEQRMPGVMDDCILPDMGRMDG
jgi:hypothetical protein